METQMISEFVELSKRLNVTETARVLNMAQPTLSKHISNLEQSLRFPLFERSTSGMRLTRAGMELLPSAYALVEAQEQFLEKAAMLRAAPLTRLSIGGATNEECSTEAMARLIQGMSGTYGMNFIELKAASHKSVPEMLDTQFVDIAFDFVDADDIATFDNVDCVTVGKTALVAIVTRNHPLASRKAIEVADLKDYTFTKLEGSHLTSGWNRVRQVCHQHGFEPITRRQYSMKQFDLLSISSNLGSDVLIVGASFVRRIYGGTMLFAKAIPIVDEDAFLPISAVFRMDNTNPLLNDAIDFMAPEDLEKTSSWKHEREWIEQLKSE